MHEEKERQKESLAHREMSKNVLSCCFLPLFSVHFASFSGQVAIYFCCHFYGTQKVISVTPQAAIPCLKELCHAQCSTYRKCFPIQYRRERENVLYKCGRHFSPGAKRRLMQLPHICGGAAFLLGSKCLGFPTLSHEPALQDDSLWADLPLSDGITPLTMRKRFVIPLSVCMCQSRTCSLMECHYLESNRKTILWKLYVLHTSQIICKKVKFSPTTIHWSRIIYGWEEGSFLRERAAGDGGRSWRRQPKGLPHTSWATNCHGGCVRSPGGTHKMTCWQGQKYSIRIR